MKKVLGLILFFIGIGLLLSILIPGRLGDIIISIVLLVIGYNLFCACGGR